MDAVLGHGEIEAGIGESAWRLPPIPKSAVERPGVDLMLLPAIFEIYGLADVCHVNTQFFAGELIDDGIDDTTKPSVGF